MTLNEIIVSLLNGVFVFLGVLLAFYVNRNFSKNIRIKKYNSSLVALKREIILNLTIIDMNIENAAKEKKVFYKLQNENFGTFVSQLETIEFCEEDFIDSIMVTSLTINLINNKSDLLNELQLYKLMTIDDDMISVYMKKTNEIKEDLKNHFDCLTKIETEKNSSCFSTILNRICSKKQQC